MLRLKIAIVLFLCLVVVQISNAFDDTGGVYEISATIAPDARRELDNIISSFSTNIPNESIKFKEAEGIIFIRLDDKRFCIFESCVTLITIKCGHPTCQYASVLVPPRFWLQPVGGRFGTFIRFPATRSKEVTTVAVNSRFITAFRAL
jgi:hypothetical protein